MKEGITDLCLLASASPLLREWGSGSFLSSWRLVIEIFESVNVLQKKQSYSTSLAAFAIKQAPYETSAILQTEAT